MGHPVVQVVFRGKVVQSVPFDREVLRIGRSRDNEVVIDNLSVSRHHAKLWMREGQVILEDQGSENGCLVNGRRASRTAITDEDEVFIGKHQLVLRAPESDPPLDEDADRPRAAARGVSPWDDARTYCVLAEGEKPALHGEQVTPARHAIPPDAAAHGEARLNVYAGLILQRAGRLERIVAVEASPFVLGRSPECDLVLDGPGSSRRHARILREGDRFLLEDLGSANGTLVNGARAQRCPLEVGDELRIDEFQLTFVLESRPLGEEIRVEAAARGSLGSAAPPEQTLLCADGARTAVPGAEPVRGELFGSMEELTPTPPEATGGAPRGAEHLRLELELDPGSLPAALRRALEDAPEAELRLPVTLRLRRS